MHMSMSATGVLIYASRTRAEIALFV